MVGCSRNGLFRGAGSLAAGVASADHDERSGKGWNRPTHVYKARERTTTVEAIPQQFQERVQREQVLAH
jgi:hypothetical protein